MSHKQMFFFSVKDASSKVSALLSILDKHLVAKESIAVLLSDEKSLHFLSELLWTLPKESFRPHATPFAPCPLALIQLYLPPFITQMPILFNLTPDSLDFPSMRILYELEDTSSPYKAALFQKKFLHYQKQGFSIASLSPPGPFSKG
ncbi:MAG: DNA polymerase III subunit chi [Chlamydiae bacterium]|nr:DNA polymerase III subunit chi [Chlamydiota bacterium]